MILCILLIIQVFGASGDEVLVSESNNVFGFGIYSKMKSDSDPILDNLVFSPLSIFNVMTMASAGSGTSSTTFSQIWNTLRCPCSSAQESNLLQGIKVLNDQLQIHNVTTLAQAFFVKSGYEVNEDYQSVLESFFEAEGSAVKFEEPGRSKINEWVSDKTAGLIPELLPSGVLSESTLCVLINAIYFRNSWKKPFSTWMTRPHQFALLDEKPVAGSHGVDMMEQTSNFYYGDHKVGGKAFKSLTLWYEHENERHEAVSEYKLLLLLPGYNTQASMRVVEDGLLENGNVFLETVEKEQIEQYEEDWEVHVKLPKFQIEFASSLKQYLMYLGIKDLFDPYLADLSRMAPGAGLFISDVIHQAKILIDEEGTEAAAATAMTMVGTSMSDLEPKKRVFWCYRPFLFLLIHAPTNTVLFQGKVVKPKATDGHPESWVQISSFFKDDTLFPDALFPHATYGYILLLVAAVALCLCLLFSFGVTVHLTSLCLRRMQTRSRMKKFVKLGVDKDPSSGHSGAEEDDEKIEDSSLPVPVDEVDKAIDKVEEDESVALEQQI